MNQIQCVPSWDNNDVCPTIPQPPLLPPLITKPFTPQSQAAPILADHTISTQDYEIAELAWENGHLTMHGLGLPRTSNKNDIESACGTLESIVNQATHKLQSPLAPLGECDNNEVLVPLYNPNTIHLSTSPIDHMSVTTDALVPNTSHLDVPANQHVEMCSTRLGSCSAGVAPSVRGYSDWSVSVSTRQSDKWHNTCEPLRSMTNGGIDSSFGASMDTTTRTVTFDDRDHDSICHNTYKRERLDDDDNQKKGTSSTKRSRKADVHNQSERKRRDKINQRMKTLQNLVPNSNKTDKASMLDEIITYVKQLQAQVQVFNTMRSSSMLMPLAIQQQQQLLQMSMMASMGMGYGMGMNVDQLNPSLNTMGPSSISGIPNVFLNPSAHMNATGATNGVDHVTPQPMNMTLPDPLSMYLASQSHSTTMEAYNKIASMCQQQPSLYRKSDDK